MRAKPFKKVNGRIDFDHPDNVEKMRKETERQRMFENIDRQKKYSLYRHYDKNGVILYIGITNNHLIRLITHSKDAPWFYEIATVKIEHYQTREQAAAKEKEAIIKELPLYNIDHVEEHYES